LTLNTIVTLKYGLEVTQGHWKRYHLKGWVRFPICLPYGRIFSHFGDIQRQSGVTLKTGLGFVQGNWRWHHLIDRIRVPIHLP